MPHSSACLRHFRSGSSPSCPLLYPHRPARSLLLVQGGHLGPCVHSSWIRGLRGLSCLCLPFFLCLLLEGGALPSSCAASSCDARPRDVEHFFMCWVALCTSALEISLFKSSAHLLSQVVWCFFFFFLVAELGEVLHEPGLPVRPKEVAFYLGNGSLLSRGGSDQICALECSPRRWYRLHQAGGRPRLSWVLGDGWGGPC